MDNKKALEAFGKCYNDNEFNCLAKLMSGDITYEAYDCLYKITTPEDVVKILDGSIRKDTRAFAGYYFWKSNVIRHLSRCILVCDIETLKCVRIVNIKIRKRKIVRITGFNPKEYEHTRGKIIV